jgi:AcrR family transcriptional regulator
MDAEAIMDHNKVQSQAGPVKSPVRQRIVAVARRHFYTHGFRSVTMDDLAGELGMSKKTIYAHFSGKAALLEAVFFDKFRNVETDLNRITSEFSSDYLAALQEMLACVQRHMEEIQPPFLRDIRRDAPEMFKLVESRRRDMIQRHFGKLIGEGQRRGIIRKDIAAELIMEILLGAVQAIINPTKMEELGLTPKAGFSAIITVVLEGVITEEGRARR